MATIFGGAVTCFILIVFYKWIIKKLRPSTSTLAAIIISTVLALLTSTIIGGYGFANGGSPLFLQSFYQYAPSALIALLSVLVIDRKKLRQ